MFSQDDDSQGVVLLVVFAVVAMIIAAVLLLSVRSLNASARTAGVSAPAGTLTAGTISAPPAVVTSAQAVLDAASVKVEQGVVKFYFASGKADLAAGASDALADVVKGAQAGRRLVISGFHDATGNAAQNAELARQRALAVRAALIVAGVAEPQIEMKKPEQITGSGSDAEARRVEISIQP